MFGSRIRGTAGEKSDIDLLIVTKKGENERKIADISSELSERFSIHVSPVILTIDEVNKLNRKREPLIENIKNESLVLYGGEEVFRKLIVTSDLGRNLENGL